MTDVLLGLPLDSAVAVLRQEKIEPEVHFTVNPRGREEGVLRVVRVQDGGRKLTAAFFLDPLAEAGKE